MSTTRRVHPCRRDKLRSFHWALLSCLLLHVFAPCEAPGTRDHAAIKDGDSTTETTKPKSFVRDALFPPGDFLAEVWETHPLLLTMSSDDDGDDGVASSSSCPANNEEEECRDGGAERLGGDVGNVIPTVHLPLDEARLNAMRNLFTPRDLPTFFDRLVDSTRNDIEKPYRLVKRSHPDGPPDEPSVDDDGRWTANDLRRAVLSEGYSISIENFQLRWRQLADFNLDPWARVHIDDAILFVTPTTTAATATTATSSSSTATGSKGEEEKEPPPGDGRNRALFTHWDVQDMFVVQLHGTKWWSVAKAPHSIYLPFLDEKVPLTESELMYFMKDGKYDDILLKPGDILYIPRGFLHNASAVLSMDGGDDDESKDPSIHFSLGIPQGFLHGVGSFTTVEALVHYALHDFFLKHSEKDGIVVRKKDCPGADYAVRWSTVLHMHLSAVARMDKGCRPSGVDGDAACGLFRKSILHRPSLSPADDDRDIFSDVLESTYARAIDAYTRTLAADPVTTLMEFVLHLERLPPETRGDYRFPAMGPWDVIVCPDALNDASSLRQQMPHALSEFRAFALPRFLAVKEIMSGDVWNTIEMKLKEYQDHIDDLSYPL